MTVPRPTRSTRNITWTCPAEFRELSQKIGSDPLLVQGAGGNTSIKIDQQMWIKASGTLLADALARDIFVAVDPKLAIAELEGAGDGSCRSALIDPSAGLRPSIETTFHAMFPETYVFHFHSVATICHAITVQGRALLKEKLAGLEWVEVPYRKPGIPLTRAIRDAVDGRRVQVVVLHNHGVIILGESISEIDRLVNEVETRLGLSKKSVTPCSKSCLTPTGWRHLPIASALACDSNTFARAIAGTYYPDHVVFLGPAMPSVAPDRFASLAPDDIPVPVVLVPDHGVFIKEDSTPAHQAMLDCLLNVLIRVPSDWDLISIGEQAEKELLNWDAEKYRQMLARTDE